MMCALDRFFKNEEGTDSSDLSSGCLPGCSCKLKTLYLIRISVTDHIFCIVT